MAQSKLFVSPKTDTTSLERCLGLRLFYYLSPSEPTSDHPMFHNDDWKDALSDGSVEAGTLSAIDCSARTVTVTWDCGAVLEYDRKKWKNLRVVHCSATGYNGPGIICDECEKPLMGFSFRCAHTDCYKGTDMLYDLCYKDYCEDKHPKEHPFMRVIPTEFFATSRVDKLPLRCDPAHQRKLYGFFEGSVVVKLDSSRKRGKVVRLVHEDGHSDLVKSKYWDCVVEVDTNYELMTHNKRLEYWDAGIKGKVEIKAECPKSCLSLYVDHFPSLNDESVMYEFAKLWDIRQTLKSPNDSEYGYTIDFDETRRSALHINLTELSSISENEEFWQNGVLRDFYFLDVLHNRLKSLPNAFNGVGDTISIAGLAFNCFETIPKQIMLCRQMNTLNLCSNEISMVSREIGRLDRLTTLVFSNNQIQYLPDIFNSFPFLKILFIDGNFLTVLPPSLKYLDSIKRINLRSNFLKTFPECLYHLETLKFLDLDENRIQVIPQTALPLVKKLSELSLRGNPLQNRKLCTDSIFEIVFQLEQQFGPLCKCHKSFRVLVTGNCGSGKTSLVRACCQQKYVTAIEGERHDHTIGINRYRWCSTPSYLRGPADIVFWDFAGEKTYSMMHQMFQSDGTLTWLVVNLNQYDFTSSIKPWLEVALSQNKEPHVWIICTHSDLKSEAKVKELRVKITEHIEEECDRLKGSCAEDDQVFRESVTFLSTHLKVICVTNTFSMMGHKDLKMEMEEFVDSYSFNSEVLNSDWPAKELLLKEKAMYMINQGKPPIVRIEDIVLSDRDRLLSYLHQSGDVLLFSSDVSRPMDMVVLDPMWLISVCREVFHHDLLNRLSNDKVYLLHQARVCGKAVTTDDIDRFASDLKHKGMLSSQLLSVLWHRYGVTDEYFTTLMSFFEQFKLAYSYCSQQEYLFPWLLEDSPSEQLCTKCCPSDANVVIARYSFCVSPPGIFEQFMIQIHRFNMLCIDNIKRHHFDAVCSDNDHKIHGHCILEPTGLVIKLCCSSSDSSYTSIFNTMHKLLQNLDDFLISFPCCGVSKYLLCPSCTKSGKKFLFDLKTIRYGRDCCRTCHWKVPDRVRDKIFKFIDEHDIAMDEICLANLSDMISENWKSFGKSGLLIATSKLNSIEEENAGGSRECAYQMLYDWSGIKKEVKKSSRERFSAFYSALKRFSPDNLDHMQAQLLSNLEKQLKHDN